MHQRLYSIFHLSEHTVAEYIRDLDRWRPVYMAGYATSLYLLARLAQEQAIVPQHAPKAVFATSEQLLPSYRHTIETVFRTRVWDAYSQDETCASITEYDCGFCHCDHAYGYVEFEDRQQEGKHRVAEIICTGFLNKAWPLLRYRVGDFVEYEPVDQCPRCGRAGPLIHEIRGRTGDVVITEGGRCIPHISLIVKDLHGIRQLQLVQDGLNRVRIRFVPADDFNEQQDRKMIRAVFHRAINEPIDFQLEKVA
jgi:phenylacetate-CoA ligase